MNECLKIDSQTFNSQFAMHTSAFSLLFTFALHRCLCRTLCNRSQR